VRADASAQSLGTTPRPSVATFCCDHHLWAAKRVLTQYCAQAKAQRRADGASAEVDDDPPLELLSDTEEFVGGADEEDVSLLRLLSRLRFTPDSTSADLDIVQILAAAAGAPPDALAMAEAMAADAFDGPPPLFDGPPPLRVRDTAASSQSMPSDAALVQRAPVVMPQDARKAAMRAAWIQALVADSLRDASAPDVVAWDALMDTARHS
jgi:hypothetical protein